MNMTRRQLGAAGMATGALLATRLARAAEALPRTYSGATLNVMQRTSPPFDAVIQAGAAFTAATGIRLNVTRVAPSDQYAKLMLDVSSRTNAYDVSAFVYQWKQDLAPFLADLGDIPKTVPGAPALALDDYPPKLLETYGRVGDKLIGLPILGDVCFLLWNTKAYRAANLPDKAPASWDEVAARGKALRTGNQFGFALPAGKAPQAYVLWTLVFHAFGGNYFAADGTPQLDSAAGLRTLQFIAKELQPIAASGDLTWDYNEVVNSLLTAQSAQAVIWPGGLGTLNDPAKSEIAGGFAIASPPGGALLGGTSIGVNAHSKHLEAAKLYVAWITSPEIVKQTADGGCPPARISAWSDPALIHKYPHFPAVQAAMTGETFGYIPMRESEQVLVMMSDAVNAVCAGTKTPEQAAGDLQSGAVAFMRRRGMLKG
jgi:multiple sugar transport system substrate-binding protein